MNFNLAVVAGDGIGPEVMEQNINVLNAIGEKFGHTFNYEYVLGGGCAIDKYGEPLPQHTIDVCKASDSVLLGAVGGWQWDTPWRQASRKSITWFKRCFRLIC